MRKLFLVPLLLLSISMSYSQDTLLNNRFSIQFGMKGHNYFSPEYSRERMGLNLNYRISKLFSLGGYLSYLHSKEYFPDVMDNNYYSIFYGINGYYHVSSYFIKKDSPKLDVYIKGSIGSTHVAFSDRELSQYNYFDWGGYIGVAYYPWERLGFFGEVGYGTRSLGEIGISLKLVK